MKTDTVITSLYFGNNNILAEGTKPIAEILKTNTTLDFLDLEYNNIGTKGAKRIAKALKINTALKGLNLGNNNIGEEGARLLAEALKINTTLQDLVLSGNTVGIRGVDSLNMIESYLQRNINLEKVIFQKAKLLNAEGNDLLDRGKYTEAIEKYNEAIAIRPKDSYFRNKLKAEESYAKMNEANVENEIDERMETLDIFQYTVTKMTTKLKDMKSIIDGIASKTQTLANIADIEQITKLMQMLITNNKITNGRLLALEDKVDELIEQQNEIDYTKVNIVKKVAELSTKLSPELIEKAINNKDGEFIINDLIKLSDIINTFRPLTLATNEQQAFKYTTKSDAANINERSKPLFSKVSDLVMENNKDFSYQSLIGDNHNDFETAREL